jgi:hypothetical protein
VYEQLTKWFREDIKSHQISVRADSIPTKRSVKEERKKKLSFEQTEVELIVLVEFMAQQGNKKHRSLEQRCRDQVAWRVYTNSSVADPDPASGFFTPASGSESRIPDPTHISET